MSNLVLADPAVVLVPALEAGVAPAAQVAMTVSPATVARGKYILFL